jgi:hypothetical protein
VKEVFHGEWGAWLDEHFPASHRTAQNYMRLADRAEDAQRLAHLGVAGALKQLAAPKPEGDPLDAIEQRIERDVQEWLKDAKAKADPGLHRLLDLEATIEKAERWRREGARAALEVARARDETDPSLARAAARYAAAVMSDEGNGPRGDDEMDAKERYHAELCRAMAEGAE